MKNLDFLSLYEVLKRIEWMFLKLLNILLFFISFPSYLSVIGDIKKNARLKNKDINKNCYILLGGLSAQEINLNYLKNSDVITVNHFFRTDQFIEIKPKYHVVTDPNFYNDNKNIRDIIELDETDTQFFLNGRYFKNNTKKNNIHLIYPIYKVADNNIKFDIDKRTSFFSTVTLNAIQIAFFLGYKEINLIGFDLPPGTMPHFYKESEAEKRGGVVQKQAIQEFDYCKLFWGHTNCLHETYALQRTAVNNGFKIFNLSEDSYVRAFPYRKFNLHK